jgi:hypothetical protein
LFRPIGYTIVTDALTRVRKEKTLKDTLRRAKSIPIIMSAAPFKDVIYDPLRDRMMTTNAKLAARVLAYMLGATADARLKDAWAKHVGRPGAKLPNSLIK